MRFYFRMAVLLVLTSVCSVGFAQGLSVRGTVSAPGAEPCAGLNIVLKRSASGTIRTVDGQYEIAVSDPSNAVLRFNFVGFTSAEAPLKNRTALDLILDDNLLNLQEVVAIVY